MSCCRRARWFGWRWILSSYHTRERCSPTKSAVSSRRWPSPYLCHAPVQPIRISVSANSALHKMIQIRKLMVRVSMGRRGDCSKHSSIGLLRLDAGEWVTTPCRAVPFSTEAASELVRANILARCR